MTTPPVQTPQDCTDPSMRDARLSLQKNLSDIAEKEAEKEKEEEGEEEWSVADLSRSTLCVWPGTYWRNLTTPSPSPFTICAREPSSSHLMSPWTSSFPQKDSTTGDKSPDKSRDGKVFGSLNGKALKLNVQLNSSIVYSSSDIFLRLM